MEEILASKRKESYVDDIEKAKALLQEEGQHKQAIELLVSISKTGDKDSTTLLVQCLVNGDGITDDNRTMVEWCVNTSEVDKRLKHAMTELFNAIKPEDRDHVCLQDIKDALKNTKKDTESNSSSDKKPDDQEEISGITSVLTSVMSMGGKDELSLSEFLDSAMSYAKGEVPEMVMVLDKGEIEDYNKASHIEKVLKYPHQTIESIKFYVLSMISKRGSVWLKSLIPTAQIQTLVLLYLYNQLSAKVWWFVIPLVIFYISMTALVVFSLQMFHGRESLRKLRNLSNLLTKLDPELTPMKAETKFMWNSAVPYVWFFIFIMLTVGVYPLCDKDWIPCAELSLIALFFTVSALRGLPDEYDDYTMYTLGIKILTMVLYSVKDLKGLWVLYYPFFTVPLPYKLEVHVSIPGILHVAILVMLIKMAGRHSWKGVYKVLIPHIVCLLWWQLFTELFVNTSWQSLARASIGWLLFITLLPLVTVYIVGVFLVNFLQWFMVLDLAMKLAVTALAVGTSSVIALYSNINIPQDVRKRRNQVLVVVAVVVVCLLGPLFYVNYVPQRKGPSKAKLSWSFYDRMCGPMALSTNTQAALQSKCGDFIDESVQWTGQVTSVQVMSIDNKFRALVTAMPRAVRPTVRCLLGGKEIIEQDGDRETPVSSSGWIFKRKSGIGCSLKKFDRYTFLMGVEFPSQYGTLASIVTVNHKYYDTMMTLKKNTTVTVKGTITDGLGSTLVKISLSKLSIDGVPVQTQRDVEKDDIFTGLKQAARYSVHFYFSPLINEQGKFDFDEDDDNDVDNDVDNHNTHDDSDKADKTS